MFDGDSFNFVDRITANFNAPYGVATGSERIIAADTWNHLVQVLAETGLLLSSYAAPNDGHTGAFWLPEGVAVQPPGDMIVADTGRQRAVTIREALPIVKVYLPLILGCRIRSGSQKLYPIN